MQPIGARFTWMRLFRRSNWTRLNHLMFTSWVVVQLAVPAPLLNETVMFTTFWSQIDGSWLGFGRVGQLSQASPRPSWSVSVCSGLDTEGQLSVAQVLAGKPGSPKPSPSTSVQGSR